MAKNKTVDENFEDSVEETSVTVVKKPKVINLVTLPSGKTKNFGEKGKLLSDTVFTHDENGVVTGFTITFSTKAGTEHTFTSSDDISLLYQAAAFGFSSKAKASTAGVAEEDLAKVIEAKIAEFNQGQFVTRTGGETTSAISQLQTAYAIVNGLGYETTEDVIKLNAMFSAMSKEEKSGLYKIPKIKLALARIQLAAAESALLAAGETI